MGAGTKIALGGAAIIAVLAIGYLALKGASGLKLPSVEFPDFKFPELKLPNVEFPDFRFPELKLPDVGFPSFPAFDQFFGLPDFRSGTSQPEQTFTPTQQLAFAFKKLIGRPEILGGMQVGNQILQTSGPITGRKIFGSDFASPERLANLFERFKGRDRKIVIDLAAARQRSPAIAPITKLRESRALQTVQAVLRRESLIASPTFAGSTRSLRMSRRRAGTAKGTLIGRFGNVVGVGPTASAKTRRFFNKRGVVNL